MIALRAHYSIDMIAGVLFAHYFWIMAERHSFIIDWYIFRIPLAKRLSNDNRTPENTDLKNEDNLVKTGEKLSGGHHFISCKNCHHPMSNYMLDETQVIYSMALK